MCHVIRKPFSKLLKVIVSWVQFVQHCINKTFSNDIPISVGGNLNMQQVYVATICNASVFYDIFIASSVCIIYNAGIVFHLAKNVNSCGTCVFLFFKHMTHGKFNRKYPIY